MRSIERRDAQARETAKKIGGRIAEVRKLKGYSQEELGRRLKPPREKQAVSLWERGEIDPQVLQLLDIARALQCSGHYLLSGLGSPDVVSTPLAVALLEGMPVGRADFQESDGRVVRGHFKTTHDDRFAEIMDDSMQPEFRPGDISIFRMGLTPAPGDFVWARIATGEHLLRQWKQVRDRNRPKVNFELVPLNSLWASEEGGADIEILGVHVELSRKYKAL